MQSFFCCLQWSGTMKVLFISKTELDIFRNLWLLSVIVEVLKILLYCVYWLVCVVHPLIMLIRIDVGRKGIGKVGRNIRRRILSEESLKKLFDKIPTKNRDKTWPVVNFDEDSLEVLILTHCYAAKLDKKVSQFETGAFWFDL